MTGYMKEDIDRSLEVLRRGGTILYPTDTIWGLGCDATDKVAVQKIYDIKKRADSKNMLILVDSKTRLLSYISVIPEVAWELFEAAVDPLTIIFPGARNLATNLLSDDGSVGIRIVRDRFCEELIRRFRKPLVSTSANISGAKAPASFDEIAPEIKRGVDYVVEWRQEEKEKKIPSSIIKLGPGGELKILR